MTAVGVEGTGSYGAELSRVLVKEELRVFEVNRPNRQHRRIRGRSDPLDSPCDPKSLPLMRSCKKSLIRMHHC